MCDDLCVILHYQADNLGSSVFLIASESSGCVQLLVLNAGMFHLLDLD